MTSTNPLVIFAAERLPQAEVAHVQQWASAHGLAPIDEARIRTMIATNRLSTPICNHCGRRANGEYTLCERCGAAWYCAETPYCRAANRLVHARWCAVADAQRDRGVMATTFLHLPKPAFYLADNTLILTRGIAEGVDEQIAEQAADRAAEAAAEQAAEQTAERAAERAIESASAPVSPVGTPGNTPVSSAPASPVGVAPRGLVAAADTARPPCLGPVL